MTTGIRNSLILHYNVILFTKRNDLVYNTYVKGLVNVNGNIIVAHGMRHGRQNQALEAFISELVKMIYITMILHFRK